MDQALEKAWRAAALDAWMDMFCPLGDAAPPGDRLYGTKPFGVAFTGLVKNLPNVVEDWDRDVRDLVVERYLKPPGRGKPNAFVDTVPFAKSVRIGFARAFGRPELLLPSEGGPSAPTAPSPEAGDAYAATFRFPFRGLREGSRARAWASSEATVKVARVEADKAPVAMRVGREGGPSLDLREYDGVLFRPILAPGGWEPITEAGFAAACLGHEGWKDDPFSPKFQRAPAPALVEYAPLRPTLSAVEFDARKEALEARMADVGRLLSIDGIVHRETEPPSLYPAMSGVGSSRPATTVVWRLRGLDMEDDQSFVPDLSRWTRIDVSCWQMMPSSMKVPLVELPCTHAAKARAISAGAARACGVPVRGCATVEALAHREGEPIAPLLLAALKRAIPSIKFYNDKNAPLLAKAADGDVEALREYGAGQGVRRQDVYRLFLAETALAAERAIAEEAIPEEDEDALLGFAP